MTSKKEEQLLFKEFPPVSTSEWEAAIEKDLKGADYEKKLVWNSPEGFKVKPYYREEDLNDLKFLQKQPGTFPYVRGNKIKNQWNICQEVQVADFKDANLKALQLISKGVTAITFNFNQAGKAIDKIDQLQQLLQGIDTQNIQLNFRFPENPTSFLNLLKETKHLSKHLNGFIEFDPLGKLTQTGGFYDSEDADHANILAAMEHSAKMSENLKVLTVHGNIFANAGASIVEELAFSLAMGSEYLNFLTGKGMKPEKVVPRIAFKFNIGTSYFMEIAKLRAARLLWSTIVKAYKCPADLAQMHVHGVTSRLNQTLFDPYVNMLRSTTESMSAVIGGVDSLTVLLFDGAFKKPSEFSEHIARNTQIILKEESHFDKITDPAAGSYYIENLTANIAEMAWELFKEVESKGGYFAAFKAGFIQDKIEATAQKRTALVAQRREVLVGTNQFPNIKEVSSNDTDETVYYIFPSSKGDVARPLKPLRLAAEFEDLRLKTEKFSGKKPVVFLLTIGNPMMRKARAGFSLNYFACAGFKVIDNPGFASVEEGVKAALDAQADITVICSSDDEYATVAPSVFEKLNGKSIVTVAGYPANSIEQLKGIGITHFVHIKTNALEVLREYQKELGIL